MTNPILNGPQAPESNPPIKPQYFKPSRFVISAIQMGAITIVTTDVPHNYVLGQQVRLLIPAFYGAYQLNERVGFVVGIPAPDQVALDIVSYTFNSFIPNPAYGPTPPQIIAIGDNNNNSATKTSPFDSSPTISGSFINISPF